MFCAVASRLTAWDHRPGTDRHGATGGREHAARRQTRHGDPREQNERDDQRRNEHHERHRRRASGCHEVWPAGVFIGAHKASVGGGTPSPDGRCPTRGTSCRGGCASQLHLPPGRAPSLAWPANAPACDRATAAPRGSPEPAGPPGITVGEAAGDSTAAGPAAVGPAECPQQQEAATVDAFPRGDGSCGRRESTFPADIQRPLPAPGLHPGPFQGN